VTEYLLTLIALLSASPDFPKTPTFGTTVVIPSGLKGDVYLLPKGAWRLPDFEDLRPVGTIWTSSLNVSPRRWKAGFPGVTKRFEWFAINYTGRFWIEAPGVYRFSLLSDDGSKLFVDDALVIDNDCQHPPLTRESAIELAGGIHHIRVAYFQGPRDCLALRLAVAGPGETWHIFSTDEFKPPANPEDWKYSAPGELTEAPERNAAARKAKYTKESKAMKDDLPQSSAGCLAPDPVPQCHE